MILGGLNAASRPPHRTHRSRYEREALGLRIRNAAHLGTFAVLRSINETLNLDATTLYRIEVPPAAISDHRVEPRYRALTGARLHAELLDANRIGSEFVIRARGRIPHRGCRAACRGLEEPLRLRRRRRHVLTIIIDSFSGDERWCVPSTMKPSPVTFIMGEPPICRPRRARHFTRHDVRGC